jgi:mRNA-degrading endonuclease RelE of RelBE toxin-antitoxin system
MPILTARAIKDIDALPAPMQAKVRGVIGRLDDQPALGKKLLGALAGLRSARVGRSYRVIYRLGDDGVTVLTVTLRRDAYR